MNSSSTIARSGQIVDIINKRIFPGNILVKDGIIRLIMRVDKAPGTFIIPGFIDAHIHIESSMLIPSEFARLAVVHGTVATVSDPHEIANVMGIEGVEYMIENGKKVPFKFYFGAPSCVPATPFETAGARLGPEEIEQLLAMDEVKYLSEMMNFPGVLNKDKEVEAKLAVARKYGKPVDGHAPGLKGDAAAAYIRAGISTDHECFSLEEALDKAHNGMNLLIREGSAAKNFNTLIPAMKKYPEKIMFCSDDRHPNDLADHHINDHVKRAVAAGFDPIDVLRACTLHPVRHYGLDVGLLRENDPADFIIVDNLTDFNVLETFVDGIKVAENGHTLIDPVKEKTINKFNTKKLNPAEIRVKADGNELAVIRALDGELITQEINRKLQHNGDPIESDTGNDILKIIVYNRYFHAPPAVGFVHQFGLKRGAIASTVAHDSHNIIAVGTSDEEICRAGNLLVERKGGISLVDRKNELLLPLPVAGLMSNADGFQVAEQYSRLDKAAKDLGSTLRAPYMTLSFMALLVIPDIKLSDKGLFDGKKFGFIPLVR
ncbi:MAG: adenine deaminase [Bacteroidales bacterium]|nr:adenine deaminase [Bacteroidales bacterium]